MLTATKAKVSPGKLLIDGQWVEGSGRAFDTINPATGDVLTQVAEATQADVDRAVASARKAFEDQSGPWRKMSASERGKVLWRIADLIDKNIEELAELETLDNGKPIFESRYVDMPMVADVFRYYAGWATKIHGETVNTFNNSFTYTLREPLGVVGAIVAWNFPLLLASWKLGPALACGNTVVLNLVKHPGIDKIAFTGSTSVGKEIMRSSADTLKRVTLELGGKSPNIVFADSAIDTAVKGALNGIFYGKGEVCCAGSRLFIEKRVEDEFMTKLLEAGKKIKLGDPLDPKTRLGAVVSETQMNTVLSYIDAGNKEGAKLLAGGKRAAVNGDRGFFIEPTIFGSVKNDMKIAQEEIFGPVLATLTFDDMDEVADMANKNVYGLAAAIWTSDIKKAHQLSRRLKAGTVWINTYGLMDAALPFGGYKQSGFGRELGMHAIEHYTELKTVWMNL